MRSSDGFLSKPLRPEPPPDCMLVSGKLPMPDLLLSVLSLFAVLFCCDDWVSPPDCTDFLEQPETPKKATLATSANAILKGVVPIRMSPLAKMCVSCLPMVTRLRRRRPRWRAVMGPLKRQPFKVFSVRINHIDVTLAVHRRAED